jgi:anti-anti-sigma factor
MSPYFHQVGVLRYCTVNTTTAWGEVMADDDSGGFAVHERVVEGVTVVEVHDVVDMLTAPLLGTAIGTALAAAPRALVVDLSEVTFLASAGMTVLVKAKEQIGESGGFAVVADGPATSRPLKLVGLDDALGVHPTLAAALLSLG